ncbi:hypothetical protein [Saccharopolyspora taberi]|uniref:Uncharacterized protein n=1 Tax=Saccharopolyspora taberi TaxID=60895 RepID=A0ABN3VJY4_9PSEU
MPVYVQLATCLPRPLVGTSPSLPAQIALDRAYESIAVLCEELEQAQREIAAKNAQLGEATTGVRAERYEAMRADRDYWRESAETIHRKLARTTAERDDAVWELAVLKRSLAELAGESA